LDLIRDSQGIKGRIALKAAQLCLTPRGQNNRYSCGRVSLPELLYIDCNSQIAVLKATWLGHTTTITSNRETPGMGLSLRTSDADDHRYSQFACVRHSSVVRGTGALPKAVHRRNCKACLDQRTAGVWYARSEYAGAYGFSAVLLRGQLFRIP